MSDIYNKNAREKALLEEAYGSIYNEGQIDWSKAKKKIIVDLQDRKAPA